MKRQFSTAIFLVVVFGLALTAESAELFTQSHAWTEEKWGSEILRAEPVEVNLEAIRPRERGPYRVQALASVASLTFTVDGIQQQFAVRTEEHGGGNFSNFGKVDGSDWQSYYTVTGRSVVGELWTPQGHRSLRTIGDTTYLVEWDEAEVARLIMNEVSVTATVAKKGRRRAVRHPSPEPKPCTPEQVETTNLLIVYNDQALARLGEGIQARDAMVATGYNLGNGWNAAVINTTGALMDRVNIVGVEHVDYIDGSSKGGSRQEQETNMSQDLNWLENSPAVKSLMQALKADAVVFFGGRYTELGGLADKGYAIVSSFHVFVSSHELGHALILAGHEPAIWPVPSGLPVWAVDRAVPGVGRGFMAYGVECVAAGQDCPWQPLLAMSGVFYPGTQIESGILGQQENGRLLSYMRNTVAFATVSGNECAAVSFAP
ncbi:MAG: hypothetical protein M3M85_03360 [bacterium]|nr:hypothetical protein [bacterium]